MFLYALTIFISAFLLFLVQPIVAKQILPWFGGTAAVWTTCLVFFQFMLLAGYYYADWTTRRLTPRRQTLLHIGLVTLSLALLPIVPDADWKPHGDEQPSLRILLLLTATIGLPYFLLAATSPLLQAWIARARGSSPYRLFALSNLASMVALLGYPFWVEPAIATGQQAFYWSIGFGAFAILIAWTAWQTQKASALVAPAVTPQNDEAPHPSYQDYFTWIALAGLGSILLLAVSNHLTQNIASIPLLWVLPLGIYLLTFTLSFNADKGVPSWYPRNISLPQTALAICAMAWLLADKNLHFMLLLHVVVFSAGLFIACMYCHGELAARVPAPRYLTRFYLMIALGGALGALLVGIIAPLILSAYYELGLAVYALALLATWLLWKALHWVWRIAALVVCAVALCAWLYGMSQYRKDAVLMSRNFYGTLRVKESGPTAIGFRKRSLVHGAILHGDQYLDEPHNRSPTTYFQPTSGAGLSLSLKRELQRPLRVGIVGLGTGTLAAYGKSGDVFRFYEINAAVVNIAQHEFTYLKDTAADIEIALGDARLSLERETPQRFDVLAIDAFSSDSIPMHLITVEAIEAYERHMRPDGIIAFHVSNRYLELQPVVAKLAAARDLHFAWINETKEDGSTASDWVLLCRDESVLQSPSIANAAKSIPPKPNLSVWTDDFNNLVQALR